LVRRRLRLLPARAQMDASIVIIEGAILDVGYFHRAGAQRGQVSDNLLELLEAYLDFLFPLRCSRKFDVRVRKLARARRSLVAIHTGDFSPVRSVSHC